MDFKETYKKYLDGTATEEEKAFVEAEIEKARMVNAEILSSSDTEKISEEKLKAKKKKSLRQTIKTIIISLIVFAIVFVILIGSVGIFAITNAKKNYHTDENQAVSLALEQAYIYARDNLHYAGSMEQMVIKRETKELEWRFPLRKCHYSYEFEFIAGYTEIDITVNADTGRAVITDVDRLD